MMSQQVGGSRSTCSGAVGFIDPDIPEGFFDDGPDHGKMAFVKFITAVLNSLSVRSQTLKLQLTSRI